MAVCPRLSYLWKITPYALKRHRAKGCFCKVYGGVHAHSCIMGNQGKMAGNSKICFEIQSQLLPEFIYLTLFMWKEYLTSSKKLHLKVAEHSFGSLWVYVICQIMTRRVAAHKLKLGKWKIYWWKTLIDR